MAHKRRSASTVLGIATFAAGLLVGSVLHAADTTQNSETLKNAESFVMKTGHEVISILQTGDEHRVVLKRLFRTRFDHKLMGRFALGPFWKQADTEQRAEYNDLFATYVPNGYMGRLSEYRGADFVLVKSRNLSGSDAVVTTRLAPKQGDPIVFDWRVRETNSQYKVIDLMVGSVSYLKTLRQEFTSVAARNGIEGLLDLLRQHAAANAADTGRDGASHAASRRASAAIVSATKFGLQSAVIAMR